MALLWDGSVWTWGSDVSGKLGDGQVSPSYNVTNNDSFLPLRVHGLGNTGYLTSIVAISAGESHNLALRSDGTVWAWGWNFYGQLGNGATSSFLTPNPTAAPASAARFALLPKKTPVSSAASASHARNVMRIGRIVDSENVWSRFRAA